jgi:hypothetical protein
VFGGSYRFRPREFWAASPIGFWRELRLYFDQVLRVLGAWGDGRALVTDDELAERVRMLRDNGRISHNAHQDYSYDSRLDTIQVTMLQAKLERYEMIQLDVRYLQGWSFAGELRILARTLTAMLRGGGM